MGPGRLISPICPPTKASARTCGLISPGPSCYHYHTIRLWHLSSSAWQFGPSQHPPPPFIPTLTDQTSQSDLITPQLPNLWYNVSHLRYFTCLTKNEWSVTSLGPTTLKLSKLPHPTLTSLFASRQHLSLHLSCIHSIRTSEPMSILRTCV